MRLPLGHGRCRGRLVAAVVLVLLAAAGLAGLPRQTPRLTVIALPAATSLSSPTAAPVLPWPRTGSGTLVLQGIGTLRTRPSGRPVPIASLAKVATALVVLHDHPLVAGKDGPVLTISAQEAADYDRRRHTAQSLLAVRAGERLTERQALEGLLLPSADNIADVLARWDGGRVRLLKRMNALAQHLGATRTRYTDPSGLDPTTTSTADDQVRVGLAALASPALMGIAEERRAVLPVAGEVRNYDALLARPDVVGIKTGSTTAAGGCLMFAARKRLGGRTTALVGVLLGVDAGRPNPLLDLAVALRGAAAVLDRVPGSVVEEPVVAASTAVAVLRSTWGATSTVATGRAPLAVLLRGASPVAQVHVDCRRAPLRAGDRCGQVDLTVGDALSGTRRLSVPLSVVRDLDPPSFLHRLASTAHGTSRTVRLAASGRRRPR